jgi:hypothetical protein
LKHPHPHFRSTFQCQIPLLQWWEVPEQLLLSEGIAEIYTELLEAEQRARQMGNGGWFLSVFKEKMRTNHRILVLHHFIKPKCYHNADSQGISRPNMGLLSKMTGLPDPLPVGVQFH